MRRKSFEIKFRSCQLFLSAERQKLVRRIKKLKKVKEEGGEEDVDNNDLLEARVLLNYVLVSLTFD